jgi:hypothetical protein
MGRARFPFSFARSSLVAGVRLYRACSARADLYITDI